MDNYTPPLTTQIQKRKQNSTLNTHACAEPIEVIKLQSANQDRRKSRKSTTEFAISTTKQATHKLRSGKKKKPRIQMKN